MSAETVVIANVTENTWTLHRTYGTFFINGVASAGDVASSRTGIPACPPSGNGEKPWTDPSTSLRVNKNLSPTARVALTVVTPRTSIMDLGDKRTMDLRVSAREIADDLCREINGDAGEDSFLGAFVCA